MNENENPILEGVIWKQLLVFFLPILMGSFFQQLYNTIDSLIVGNFVGTQALAAVGGSSALIVHMVVGFFSGLSAGSGVLISQAFGAGNRERVRTAVHTAYAFSIIGGIALSVLGVLFSPKLLLLMRQPEDIMEASVVYLRIYFAGLLAVFIYNMGSGIMRAMGNSRLPLYYLIVSSLINVALDLLLVLCFRMGVVGVAVATLIAQSVSAVLVTAKLIKGMDGVTLVLSDIRVDMDSLKKQLRLGIPGGSQTVMYSLANMMAQTALNSYGTKAVAGWTAEGKIEVLYWMINSCFGIAITTFVGQNYGAGKMDRVRRGTAICLGMHLTTTAVFSTLYYIFGRNLIAFFAKDPEVLNYGTDLMRAVAPFFVCFCFMEVFSGTLRGVGDVFIPTILILTCMCLFRIAWMTLILPHFHSLSTVIWMYPVSWSLGALAFIVYYLIRRKKLLM